MAKTVATLEAVFAAADALVASGVEPQDEAAAVDVPSDMLARGSALARELYAHALPLAEATVTQPLDRAVTAMKKAEGQVATAEAEVAGLEDAEQSQAEHIDRPEIQVRELELSAAAQQATLREKTEALARMESRLAELQAKHQESLEELAGLKASTRTTEALHGQLKSIHRSVQGLAGLSDRRTAGG